MASPVRKKHIEKATAMIAKEDDFRTQRVWIFFTSYAEKFKPPVPRKQFLSIWSAIFPFSLVIPLVI